MEWAGRILMLLAALALAVIPVKKAQAEGTTLADKGLNQRNPTKKPARITRCIPNASGRTRA